MKAHYTHLTAVDCYDPQPGVSERSQTRRLFSKYEKASDTPSGHGLIGNAYDNVIVLQSMPSKLRGLISLFASGMAGLASFGGLYAIPFLIRFALQNYASPENSAWGSAFDVLLIVLFSILSAIAFIAAIRSFRLDWRSPKEVPLVLNRKSRKVFRFVQDVPGIENCIKEGGVWGAIKGLSGYVLDTFRPWPGMLLIEYDWDCLEAEYYKQTGPSGNVIRTDHYLNLFVREAPGSDKVIGSFPLAPSMMVGETMACNVWEHVRRFMEENGPALSPGDVPGPAAPRGFWQGLNSTSCGSGWIVFLAIAIWLWPETRNEILYFYDHTKYLYLVLEDKTLLNALWKPFVAFPTYFVLVWSFFGGVSGYLSPEVTLPSAALEGAGERLDLAQLAKAGRPASPTPVG